MKQNRFTIFLKNGYYRTVFGYSMKEAIVKGLSWAYEYGYEPTIERIEEEIEEGDIIVKTIYIDIACNVIAFKLKEYI